MSDLFNVSTNPHVRSKDTTQTIMRDVLIALAPASIFGVYNFGLDALIRIVVGIAACMAFEALYQYLMHKKITVMDLSLMDMFIGKTGGVIGETSVICLLIGAIYLVFRKVISLRIPVTYVATFAVLIFLFAPGHQFDVTYLAEQICGGGLILGAFFMATDYVTSPITPNGKIVFGVVLGLLTFIFRMFGGSAEGVSYAIIFSNLLVPLIEMVTVPKSFGKKKPEKEAAK